MMAGRCSRSSWRALTGQTGSPPNVSDASAPMLLRQLRLFAADHRRIIASVAVHPLHCRAKHSHEHCYY